MKKLLIFDLDGTLLNTINDLGCAANYALEQCGLPTHPLEAYPKFVGNGITRLIQRTLPDGNFSQEEFNQLRDKFIEYYGVHMADTTVPYPGIPELLTRLTDSNVALAVASNKYQAGTEHLINHFFPTIPWVAIEGHRENIPVKPDPSIVFGILGKYPTLKTDVLYIGDSDIDIATARRAGIESVGVSWGFQHENTLIEAGADHIVHSPDDIWRIAAK